VSWRKAHGTAARSGRLTVLESPPADELPAAKPEPPGPGDRDARGRFVAGNRWARVGGLRLAPRGVLADLEAKAPTEWRQARAAGRRAAHQRVREFCRSHGGELSSGVCALIGEAAEQRADARYLRAKAAADGNVDLLRVAAQLSTAARQAERDAWELASREAAARPRKDFRNQLADRIAARALPAPNKGTP
jgi:hypothetical protein